MSEVTESGVRNARGKNGSDKYDKGIIISLFNANKCAHKGLIVVYSVSQKKVYTYKIADYF